MTRIRGGALIYTPVQYRLQRRSLESRFDGVYRQMISVSLITAQFTTSCVDNEVSTTRQASLATINLEASIATRLYYRLAGFQTLSVLHNNSCGTEV